MPGRKPSGGGRRPGESADTPKSTGQGNGRRGSKSSYVPRSTSQGQDGPEGRRDSGSKSYNSKASGKRGGTRRGKGSSVTPKSTTGKRDGHVSSKRAGYNAAHHGGSGDGAHPSKTITNMVLPHDMVPDTAVPYGWLDLPDKDKMEDFQLPVRKATMPKEALRTVNVKVNHFPVDIKLPPNICRYQVTISRLPWDGNDLAARTPPKYMFKPLLQILMKDLRQEFEDRNVDKSLGIISDWSRTIYSTEVLESNSSFVKEVAFLPADGEDGWQETFGIKVELTDEVVDTHGLQAAVDNMEGQPISRELLAVDRIYNTAMKNLTNPQYKPMGRTSLIRFDREHGTKLGGGLMSYSGYDINVDITNGWRPYLNILVANHATVMSRNVITVLMDFFMCTREECLTSNGWKHYDFSNASKFLSGFKVKYSPTAEMTFGGTVIGIANKNISEETFMITDSITLKKRKVSVYDYYVDKYQRDDLNPNGICLILNKNCQVPAEICFIKEAQSAHQKLSGPQTKKMEGLARKHPKKLQVEIENAIADLGLIGDPILAKFGFTIGSNVEMLRMPATRVLAPPNICYAASKPGDILTVTPKDGDWDNWREKGKFLQPATVEKWGILITCKRYKGNYLTKFSDKFVTSITSLANKVGMTMDKKVKSEDLSNVLRDTVYPPLTPYQNKIQNTQALKAYFQEKKDKGFTMILVVLPTDGTELYGHVKQSSELVTGILTQCVTADHFCCPKSSEIKNILLKLNNKLGGINHTVVSPPGALEFRLFHDPVMILGVDVTHPPAAGERRGDETGSSYAALVSTIDRTGMRYMTQVKAQKRLGSGALEIITNFDIMITKSLIRYKNETGILPRKIIYYRDGVGDSQFTQLLNTELRKIRAACLSIEPGYEPKVTFITVQKRNKTRVFFQNDGRIENAPSGTIIDTQIIHPTEMDAFLLSHRGILGTSRPTHYRTIWDDSNFSEDETQQMTFYMCHIYAPCNRSVSIPAPVYYAHHAATRALVLADGFSGNVEETTVMLQRTTINETNPMHFI